MKTPPPLNVLVLHPDLAITAQLTQLLQPHYMVYTAQTIVEAIAQIVVADLAVILMEWDLPEGNGLEFIRQMRAEPALASTAIICVSHQGGVNDKVQAFKAGADDYVVLPIEPAQFVSRIILLRSIHGLAY